MCGVFFMKGVKMKEIKLNGYTVKQIVYLFVPVYGVFDNGIKPLFISGNIQRIIEFCYRKGLKSNGNN